MPIRSRRFAIVIGVFLLACLPTVARAACEAHITGLRVIEREDGESALVEADYQFVGANGGDVFVWRDDFNLIAQGVSGSSGTVSTAMPVNCLPPGTYTFLARARASCGAEGETTTTRSFDPRPVVSGSIDGFSADKSLITVTWHYRFPYKSPNSSPGSRELRAVFPDGRTLATLSLQPGDPVEGTKTITTGINCLAGGHYPVTFFGFTSCQSSVPTEPIAFDIKSATVTSLSIEPINAFGAMRATIGYAFEATQFANQRRVDLYFNGHFINGQGELAISGTVVLDFQAGCLPPGSYPVKAVAFACNNTTNPAYRDEREEMLTTPTDKANIDVDSRFEPASNSISLSVQQTLPPGIGSGTRTIRARNLVGDDGIIIPGAVIRGPETVTPSTPPLTFSYTPPVWARTVEIVATLDYCNGRAEDVTTAKCTGSCDAPQPPTATSHPVSFDDGNMRYGDGDPLPPMLEGMRLTRNYDSEHRIRGAFGLGWVSMFDNRLLIDTDPSGDILSVTNENNESAVFVRRAGVYTQIWPKGRSSLGTMTFEAATSQYLYRPAGSTTALMYRDSDGRFTGLRRLGTGREMRITYTAGGVPQSVTDSWTGLVWNITADPATTRITAIEIAGLTWQYQYTGNNLTTVLAPGAATWRTYEYTNDRMTAARDPLGNLIEGHTYDASGRAITESGPTDEIDSIQYNAAGSDATQTVTRVTMKSGQVSDYILTPSGGTWRTVRIVNGCTSCGSRDGVFTYDGDGHLLRAQRADGYVTTRTYSGQRIVSMQEHLRPVGCDPETSPTRCLLDPASLQAAALEPTTATITTSYEYGDPAWPDKPTAMMTTSVGPIEGPRREEFSYHPLTGELVSHSIAGWTPNGSVPVTVTRFYGDASTGGEDRDPDPPGTNTDPFGPAFNPGGTFQTAWLSLPQPRRRKSVDGPRTDVADITSFVYYPVDASVTPATLRGRLAAVRNAAGQITRHESYDVFGNPARIVDANGVATEMTYDALGRLSTSTVKGVAGCDPTADPLCASDLTTTRTYSPAAGPLQREQRPAGGVTTYEYDERGRVKTLSRGPSASDLRERIEYTYDSLTGKKSNERLLAWESNAWMEKRTESYSYDLLAQLRKITHADNTFIEYTYDQEGRVATTRDENHTAANTTFSYDPADRIAAVKQTLAGVADGVITTSYSYDVHGNLNAVTDPNGNVTTYSYDDLGRMLSQQSPVTGTSIYVYDDAGNLTSTQDANGATAQRTYDALNRVTSAVSMKASASETVTWSYDSDTAHRFSIGRPSTMTDPTGSTSFSYERRGMLREEAKTIGGATYTTGYQHDADGNRSSIRYPSGRVVSYTFDYADRPQSATADSTPLVTSATYLPFGPPLTIAFGNGTTRSMQYDNRYRMTQNNLTGSGDPIASYSYGYDAAGNITQLHDLSDPSFNRDFGYDDLSRLTVANSGEALWGEGSYAYDAMGNMTALTLGPRRTATFNYSGSTPKLTSVIEGESVRNVAYDAAGNEIAVGTSESAYTPRNHLRSFNGATYGYDGRGIRTTTLRATQISSFTLTPNSVGGGDPSQGTVTLSGAAPAGGAVIALTSANSSIVTVPASATVPAGQQSVTFAIQTQPVAQQENVSITASYNDSTRSETLTVSPARLDSISLSPSSFTGGNDATATISLLGAAPEEGMAVTLESNTPTASVPAEVVVPAGARSLSVPVHTTPVAERTRGVLTASTRTDAVKATFTIVPPGIASLAFAPSSLRGGTTTTGTVTLDGAAPAGGASVALSTEADALSLPASVVVPSGAVSATFSAATSPVEHDASARVTASFGESAFETLVRITAPQLAGFEVTPATLVGGETANATAKLDAPAATSGAPVAVTSSDQGIVPAPATITVPSGATTESAALPTEPVAASTPVVISATRNGITRSSTLTLQPPPVTIASLSITPSSLVGTNSAIATVTLTDTAPGGGVEIELRSSDPDVASVPSALTIPAGATSGTFAVATSLVAAPRLVVITASHASTEKTAQVTVQPPAGNYVASLAVNPSFIIGGSSAAGTVTLALAADKKSDVTLTSSNPALLAVPSTVTVKQKDTTAEFTVSSSTTTTPAAVMITATFGGVTQRTRVIVAPANAVTLATFTITPSRIAGGSSASGIVTLTSAAPSGGAPVTIEPRRRNIVSVPATVTVPEGATSAAFAIAADVVHGKKEKSTEIAVSYDGITLAATITVTPPTTASVQPVAKCASVALEPCLASPIVAMAVTSFEKTYNLYTPELNLLAETIPSTSVAPPIAYEYVWFGGQPLAQIDNATGAINWYFDDHLGTPILQTDKDGRVVWRPEYEPYGAVFAYRRGEARHQPLRFPGQEADGSAVSYNIFRWYQSSQGRYTQSDPIGLGGGLNVFRYAIDNPASFYDRSGLVTLDLSKITVRKLFTVGDLDSRCADTQGGVSGGGCTRSYYAIGRCNCLCLGFGMWAPVARIEVHGDMFIYNGFWPTFLQHRKPRDPNVVSAATAEHHEYAWHISPALAALVQTVANMEANFYFGKPACDSQCTAIAQTVNSEFARLMALSQQLEQNGQNSSTPGLVH